ncbi:MULTISPECIES: hypothetical protein [unclassified Pseudomonas]|uniref:hypothetical protein n=1 Tax=unclassified Pseudomonas TaxID=196821 RepID=UPI00244D0781|nr:MULTISPECIES: hypothetical protein [unclassified Pseudomonas]MDG9924180.1 hypothetical protein [Pseudomonas sp. GD04045]MDH0036610.1 hypothetical protein [Pseudomonas sp. GD04019]
MSKFIKWGLLAIVAVAILIKASLWLSVRSIMNDAIAQMSPFMNLSYRGITSSFDGRVGVEGIKVQVPMFNDDFHIAHAELKFKSLMDLLSFKERLAEGKFPEQMAVNIKGLTLDVHGPFMEMIHQAPEQPDLETALTSVACGSSSRIGVDELLEMGYRTFETDAQFSYLFQPGAQTLSFNLSADMRDMGDYRINFSLANMSEKPGDLRVNPPRVSTVTVEINDNQYQRKVSSYCAAKLGQSEEAYLQTSMEHLDQSLRAQRIALDPALLESLKAYYKDPQALRVELAPTEGMTWDGLQFFEAKDVLAMLRPAVLINQQAVEPLAFSWVDPQAAPVPVANELVRAEENEQVQVSQYEFVNVESLPNHAGKRLQFITYDGTYYQGVLHKIENGKVFLSVQMGTGSAEMFLRLEKIDKVRVLF